jgi:hypothetical protein
MWGSEKQDIMDNFLKCPFCLSQSVEAKSGKSNCPVCFAEFEIDDRLECIFIDPINLKLPVNRFVCRSCGLVQGYENRKCVFCGAELGATVQ